MPMSDAARRSERDCDECHGEVRAGYYCAGCGLNRCDEAEEGR